MPELLDRKARVLAPLVGGKRGAEQQIAILEVAGEIEWAQARLAGPAAYAEVAARAGRTPKLPLERVADIYRRYQDEKRKRGVIDFDDLIRLTAHALETDTEFAATQRWRFRHLFVDEFQDVSRAQLACCAPGSPTATRCASSATPTRRSTRSPAPTRATSPRSPSTSAAARSSGSR